MSAIMKDLSEPWDDWYHCNGNTYGTWLRGDPRGWRARHHREHVEGDYRKPPAPGTHERELAQSRQLMNREPVRLSREAAAVACARMAEALRFHLVMVEAMCVDDHHFHVLVRCPDHDPRKWVGIAKKESARALSSAGLAKPGGVWAVRFRCLPVKDESHFANIARYIAAHERRGASVWTRSRTH